MNFESNPDEYLNQFPNQFLNQNQNQFSNEILNQFENKFGINSRIKIQEFQDKYPLIFLALLGQITQEYLAKNPQVMVEIYQQLLEQMNRGIGVEK